ncbi:adenylate/guanylate cyclase domain-containing protein [Mycobacterium tuberculosis]|uniref:Adenylate cyclase 2 n=4 Tax=Mycobacterium tuberculosis TaxID=1773 RepID=A0AA44RKM6_MYCTX|nr:adenylate/guanylate cyclase domain-containing protein [Mycobacterium tuberculosis]OMH55173.1 Adenylate cyclase 2 [Mycobacterium tuberculosis]OMH59238.1 Adenylate cyclase 2 [Mycobacterium tuberculosis]
MSKTREQRLRRVLETMTRQHDRLRDPPAYGSWLLGWVSERPLRRRVRIQIILTIALITANLVGIGLAVLLENVAFPTPSIVSDAPLWITFVAGPAYTVIGMALGSYYVKVQTLAALRWASEEHTPSRADQRNTLLAPLRVAVGTLILWAVGAALFTTLYGLANRLFIPQVMFSTLFCGVLVATACYMLTEFALRPVAAQALEAGLPPGRFALGIIGRTMVVWLLSSGVPLFGIALLGILEMVLQNFTDIQFAYGVLIVSSATLIGGFLLMWILAWLTAAPVRVVRAALKRVEQGDLRGDLVVFDGTELGELQRGFNAMVNGLRERERVRDLFGRHVGREVAAAERERPQLGGEDRHAAVVFVDIVGSTQLVDNQPAAHVVKLLNRFFAIVVNEVDRHHGLINKFAGDAALAIFGAPNRLDRPEDAALAAARAIAERLANEMPEVQAGIGVAAGQIVAGNVGAKQRFEYTVVGKPVNQAARLCELAKSHPARLLASSDTLHAASETERAHWSLGETVTLRGHEQPTRLAVPT